MVTGIQHVYDSRAAIVTQMQEITSTAAKEGRVMTQEEVSKWTKMEADEAALTKTIEATEKTNRMAAEQAAKHFEQRDAAGQTWTSNSTEKKDGGKDEAYRTAFTNYYRYGIQGISSDERKLLNENRGTSNQVAGTNSLGGFTVPTGFFPGIERAMLDYSGIMQAAQIRATDSGQNLPFTTEDDTTTIALLVAEAAAFTVQDLTLASVSLDSYKYGTVSKISWELLQDSAFDMAQELVNSFGARFGRAMNASATTGTGSAQPNGVVTASTLGKTAASATAVTFPEVLDLIHSIDPAYRASPKFGLMFNDTILLALKKLTIGSATNDSRPLWQPSYVAGQPDKIDGFQYWINQGMASAMTTGQKIMLAGDFDKFVIRMVKDLTVLRLDELYANNGIVGFQGYMRWDSDCLNTAAIKHLKLA